jgi:hypothetical protein
MPITDTPPRATLAHLRTLSFEGLSAYLRDPAALQPMRASLRDVLSACARWFPAPEPLPAPDFGVFLSAYLIALHPDLVFERDTEETSALTASAVGVTEHYDSLISPSSDPHPRSEHFHERLLEHQAFFSAWRRQDEPLLVARVHGALRSSLVQLLELSPDAEVDRADPTAVGLRAHIEMLRAHLRRLTGGPAALRAFDEVSAQVRGARHASRLRRVSPSDN